MLNWPMVLVFYYKWQIIYIFTFFKNETILSYSLGYLPINIKSIFKVTKLMSKLYSIIFLQKRFL